MRRLLLVLILLAGPAWAFDPSEMLSDPVLEARAQALDHEIRCIRCQSEAVASSNAEWAYDARRMIRELVSDGKSDDEVLAWFQARYGDFVLMDPPKKGANILLWLAGPILLLAGLGIAFGAARSRRGRDAQALSPEEEARVRELLKDG